ncbi:monovalent cation:H+ antiporter-2, CPA2 family [Duganella sp. CF402]|uniref:YbaL family putative K(+) efflux transporter n=1 Tax=unclassified Duganella TaxID=2636909 RepID=UPI0008D19E79|nr:MULTISPECIES: YbaL family putative K(+) efflux transporter [unclassified Duganella]RZT05749.1 Kef-type potassium/proton antiporter (CPA2 family) [Duganella sp. BK701]SEM92630.1 monovalent cation:H+ antiporter-2, CPA2 family [Duganella sp. CF402]
MPHNISLITTIAAALGAGLLFGYLATRLKLPALVGYLAAGIIIGPATPGFVADTALAGQLAEIGVMLMMFGVGLHFSLDDLWAVRKVALPGAVLQIAVATALGMGLAHYWGWSIGGGLVFGLALSVASTVVLLRALEERGILDSFNGRIAVGWLVVEDLVTVLVLVLLPALAGSLGGEAADAHGAHGTGGGDLWTTLAITLGQVTAFIVLMLVVGRKLFPWILWQVARTNSRELFTLCVIAAAVGIAYASTHYFGVSFALGSFFAGMVLRESALAHRAAEESLPLRDAFAVLFFVSVGMLFEPSILIEQPLKLLAVVLIIVVGKSVAAFLLVIILRYPAKTALMVSASLAQIGEFSFILAALGLSLKLMPVEGQSLILAGAIISIALNPVVFRVTKPLERWLSNDAALAAKFDRPADPLAELPMSVPHEHLRGQVVLVGYGRVGRRIAAALKEQGIAFVVAEQNREVVDQLRKEGVHAVAGNAGEPAVLIQAHIAHASMLVIATPDTFHVRTMIETARALNPNIKTVVRTHSDEEADLLRNERAGEIFMGEQELAKGMTAYVLDSLSKSNKGHTH